MSYDVVIVGGGPAGLAAAIRLKQLVQTYNTNKRGEENEGEELDLSVCILEKGSEVGSHILSGNVFDPKALDELMRSHTTTDDNTGSENNDENNKEEAPSWIQELYESQNSIATPVSSDAFLMLTESGSAYKIPNVLLPSQLHNDGNYILSLSQLVRYLGEMAEESYGVEIYPGFAADEVLYEYDDDEDEGDNGGESNGNSKPLAVRGVATKDAGISKDGTLRDNFERGIELLGRQTLFAEGARGSCSERVVEAFGLRDGNEHHPPRYGLGIKEVWEVPVGDDDDGEKSIFQPGYVQHTLGYPLQSSPFDKVYGGSFLYHQEPNLVLCGLVVGLDYENPYLNPYKEFQRWKTHPAIARHLKGGTCIQYGARVLNEGGYHSLPKLTFPGGMLLGCAAGFLNAVKIKGSHCAIKSGIVAAESVFEALVDGIGVVSDAADDADAADVDFDAMVQNTVAALGEIPENESLIEVSQYGTAMESSWVYDELKEVRNCHEAFSRWGVGAGLAYTGLCAHITKGKEPWTLSSSHSSSNSSSSSSSEDVVGGGADSASTKAASHFQPIDYPFPDGVLTFDLLTNLQRSGTYHEDDQPSHLRIKPDLATVPESISLQVYAAPESRFCPAGVYEYVEEKLVINAQNCIHCKCCSIKMPHEYIDWTVPEGGGGPQYQVM